MAFLQSPSQREPFLKVPAAVVILITALVVAHVIRSLLPAETSEKLLIDYAFIPLRYAPDVAGAGSLLDRAIPFLSYQFLHADATHLGINCLWLLAFGPVVARRFGGLLFLVFFLVCGVFAAAVYLAFNWGSSGAVIGASGAISGLMAAGIRMLPIQGMFAFPGAQRLLSVFSPQVMLFTALWIVVNLVFGLTGLGVTGEIRQVAWQAHLGGYFAGLALSGVFDALARKIGPAA